MTADGAAGVAGVAEAGRPCPYCRFPLKEGGEITTCERCHAVHHGDCWRDNGGCAITACGGTAATVKGDTGLDDVALSHVPAAAAPVSQRPSTGGSGSLAILAVLGLALVVAAIGAVLLLNRPHGTTIRAAQAAAEVASGTTTTVTVSTTTLAATGSTDPADHLAAYSGPGYTVDPPAGWTTVEDAVAKTGYTESRWRQPGNGGAYALVDDTPGFSGTPESGAEGVHRQVASQAGYQQLAWGPQSYPGGTAWRWQFIGEGVEQADTFFVACGTGYAVLESAPTADWAADSALFSTVTSSFRPQC